MIIKDVIKNIIDSYNSLSPSEKDIVDCIGITVFVFLVIIGLMCF